MKRILFLMLLLLFLMVVAVSCQSGETETSAVTTTFSTNDTTAATSEGDGQLTTEAITTEDITTEAITTEALTTAENTTVGEVTEADTTYPDTEYDTSPIEQSKSEPLLIRWDPYRLSPIFEEDAYRDGAEAIIKAILDYCPTATFSSEEVMDAVLANLFYEFPPSALCTFVTDDETLTVCISYRLERSEHLVALSAFGERIETLVANTLLCGDDEATMALLLYHEISRSVDYFSVNYDTWQTNAYYALMQGKSICYGFADAFNYLLRQVGMEAYLVKSYRASDRAAHSWSLVKIDGDYYHCDPTWESSIFSGEGFVYFGYTDTRRGSTMSLKDATIGEGALQKNLSFSATSTRFDAMNGARITSGEWTLDREQREIVFKFKEYPYGK